MRELFSVLTFVSIFAKLTSRSASAVKMSSMNSLFSPYIVLIVCISLLAALVCLLVFKYSTSFKSCIPDSLPKACWMAEGLMGAVEIETVHKFSYGF